MTFKSVFNAVLLGSAFIFAALLINYSRPVVEVAQPGPEYVRATGKCAQCHIRETAAIVHQFSMSRHAQVGTTCYDCHRTVDEQSGSEHHGFTIADGLTALNCAQCHQTEYDQYVRSRHAAPAWAAVLGAVDFTPEQIEAAERYHPGTVERPPNLLAIRQGAGTLEMGCLKCHAVGRPNSDGSIGSCTNCHARHSASVALARQPQTCGQCHMGPDHAQLEIYTESKHGVLFELQKGTMNLAAAPKSLTTRDMPVPTCATCHMSGLDGLKVTHDVTERLSWFLFAPISEKRPGFMQGQIQMQEVCAKCHAKPTFQTFYREAEVVLAATNDKVQAGLDLVAALRREGHMTPEPFDEPMEFLAFDLWHYYGRTAKHGAFMGGADFVQWHGNYELLLVMTEMEALAAELRKEDR